MRISVTKFKFMVSVILSIGLLGSPALISGQVQERASGQAQEPSLPPQQNEPRLVLEQENERRPNRCPDRPVIQVAGTVDNFVGPEAATLSPALQTFFTGLGKPVRRFDEGGINKLFGQSFRLNPCKICAAQVEVRMRNEGELADNDALHVGIAPFNVRFGLLHPIWGSPNQTKTFNLPVAALNNYILTGPVTGPWWLDFYVQDDTAVDYIKLTVWYY